MSVADAVCREIERLPSPGGDPDLFYDGLIDLLSHHGTPSVGACWHLTDPSTGATAWRGARGELPGDFVAALELEYLADDFAQYHDLASRRRPVAVLTAETGGRPERSLRFRRQLVPAGMADEVRAVFADEFGRWGSICLWSDEPYSAEAGSLAARIVPGVARRLRDSVIASAAPATHEGPPGVLLLGASDRVLSRDARAGELLDGCAATGKLPGAIYVLAARARMAGGPVRGRSVTRDGGWLAVDVSPLEGGTGLAVVLREASAPSLVHVRLRAAGLSKREREIAAAVLRGDDTATIARRLFLSPWTVQDHLKSVFAKTGVRSRREFVARWAFQAAGLTN